MPLRCAMNTIASDNAITNLYYIESRNKMEEIGATILEYHACSHCKLNAEQMAP